MCFKGRKRLLAGIGHLFVRTTAALINPPPTSLHPPCRPPGPVEDLDEGDEAATQEEAEGAAYLGDEHGRGHPGAPKYEFQENPFISGTIVFQFHLLYLVTACRSKKKWTTAMSLSKASYSVPRPREEGKRASAERRRRVGLVRLKGSVALGPSSCSRQENYFSEEKINYTISPHNH